MKKHPKEDSPRIARERRTVTTMIAMYCRDHHGTHGGLCADCEALRAYAMARLDCCLFAAQKPVCNRCPVHCYRKSMREQMREVMRHSGPRMLREHPVMALRHFLDGRRKAPDRPPATP